MNDDKPLARISTDQHAENVSFVRRWSERKMHAREKGKAVRAEPPRSPTPQIEPRERELTDADMPCLADLSEHSDYSGFFSPKVSEELRRLALRKLFHSPGFNVTDGLDDYAEDFRSFARLGDTVTQDMLHRLQLEARRAGEKILETKEESAISEKRIGAGEDEETPENDGDLEA